MKNLIEKFLQKTGWNKFASVDFEHFLNRNGIAISRNEIEKGLSQSECVESTQNGLWRAV